MNQKQLEQMKNGKGFIAALDQSGGSTPKALKAYGVAEDAYKNEEEMFDLIHAMRTRIIKSKSFDERILGAILFEQTMDRTIDGKKTGDFLWEEKHVVPFLKIDKGLADEKDGVQLMKDMPSLDDLLKHAVDRHIFGTKERSVIKTAAPGPIKAVVAQQFEIGKKVLSYGLVPIIEPEVDIHLAEKKEAEAVLKEEILRELDALSENQNVMLKLTIPTVNDFYKELIAHPKVIRVVALSGGYSREDANELLAQNPGLIASFSRALAEGLFAQQSDEEFNEILGKSIEGIYEASIK